MKGQKYIIAKRINNLKHLSSDRVWCALTLADIHSDIHWWDNFLIIRVNSIFVEDAKLVINSFHNLKIHDTVSTSYEYQHYTKQYWINQD